MTPAAPSLDVYPLSPMQVGMLYQTVAAAADGVYTIVVSYRLKGPLDGPRFADAWQRVIDHQPVLRTSFDWVDRVEPVQRVNARAVLEARHEDWRPIDQTARQARLRQLLESEQRRGFDLTTAPLLRLTIIRCEDDLHEIVLSHHHILMDGSCKSMLFDQVFATYDALVAGDPVELDPPEPYHRFIEWLAQQPASDAESFWRDALKGFRVPSRLWPDAPAPKTPDEPPGEHRLRIDRAASDALRAFGRRRRLTLGTLVTGAWALALARGGAQTDVVFGTVVNVRPPDLDGADAMLGLFINTLPVRAILDLERTATDWLGVLQRDQSAAREHSGIALSSVLRWSEMPPGQPLFESIVVFENNAGYDGQVERYGELEIVAATPAVRNGLPLTLRCVPSTEVECHLLYDASRFPPATVAAMAAEFQTALTSIPVLADQPLGVVLEELAARERQRKDREAEAYRQSLERGLRSVRRNPVQVESRHEP